MPTLFTIGYEQATQAAVVSALRDAGVEGLAAQPPLRGGPLRQPCGLPPPHRLRRQGGF